MGLTEDKARSNLRQFFSNDVHPPMVVIGSGMSCTVNQQFGIQALSEHLLSSVSDKSLGTEAVREWTKVKAELEVGKDLESALNAATSKELISNLVNETGKFIAHLDEKHFFSIINGELSWKPLELLEKIYKGRHLNNAIIPIVTTNYDCLIEYALESRSLPYNLGTSRGIIGYFDWDNSRKVFAKSKTSTKGKKARSIEQIEIHFEIIKVHGSINTFKFNENPVQIESLKWEENPPLERVLVTPGLSKYEAVLSYRKFLLSEFDMLMRKHEGGILLLGYGLNDHHIDNEIQRRLKGGSKGLIITMETNQRINELVKDSSNLWLVCSAEIGKRTGTMIYNRKFENPLYLRDIELWDITKFCEFIFGKK